MSKNKKPVETAPVADKTVNIDGGTHEILRVKVFESGGKETLKSLIAIAVREKYGDGKK